MIIVIILKLRKNIDFVKWQSILSNLNWGNDNNNKAIDNYEINATTHNDDKDKNYNGDIWNVIVH